MSELHFILILFSCKIRAPGCKNKPTSFKPLILSINLSVFGKMTAKLMFVYLKKKHANKINNRHASVES